MYTEEKKEKHLKTFSVLKFSQNEEKESNRFKSSPPV
jgi:hypothetical protein